MPIQYECESCDFTTENPSIDCVYPKCGGKLVAVKLKINPNHSLFKMIWLGLNYFNVVTSPIILNYV